MTTTDISTIPTACQRLRPAMVMERVAVLTWRTCFSKCSVWEAVGHPLGLWTWAEVEDHRSRGKGRMRNYHIRLRWKNSTKERLRNSRARRMSYAATARVVVERTRQNQSIALHARVEVSLRFIFALLSHSDWIGIRHETRPKIYRSWIGHPRDCYV